MLKLAVLGFVLVLAVACSSNATEPGSEPTSASQPSSLADATATPFSLNLKDTPTPVPPTPTPTPFSFGELERCATDVDGVRQIETRPNISGWPENAGQAFDPHEVAPWGPFERPVGLTPVPRYELSGGMRVPPNVWWDDGPVTLGILAANGFPHQIEFDFSRDPVYDIAVVDSSGQEVWRYSDHIEVIHVTSGLQLGSIEEMMLEAEWDLAGKDGERVADGLYWVYGIVFREEPYRWHVSPKQMYVGERPSLQDSLDIELTAPDTVRCGDRVPMTMSITNITNSPVPIYTGVDFDNYHASVPGGVEFWNWWAGKTRILPLIVRFISPGETLQFQRSWLLEDGQGGKVPPGKYELKSSIKAAQVDDVAHRTETAWSNIVEITVVR